MLEKEEEKMLLPKHLIDATMAYLETRPLGEVLPLYDAIKSQAVMAPTKRHTKE